MNSATRMPAAASLRTPAATRSTSAATSSPPSVVISARFSGTRQQSCGRTPSAIADHLVGEPHLEIHARLQQRPQRVHVAILDVAAVFAQMQRDVVGAGLLGQQARHAPDPDTARGAPAARWRRDRC